MANGIQVLDGFSPSIDGRTAEQQIQYISDYLYQLSEQLRYTLSNLGVENFSEASLNELAKVIQARIETEGS